MYTALSNMYYLIPEHVRLHFGDTEIRQQLMYRLPFVVFKRKAGDASVQVVAYKATLPVPIVNIVEAFYSEGALTREDIPAFPVYPVHIVTHAGGLVTRRDGTVEVYHDGHGCLTVSEEGGYLYVVGETFDFDDNDPLVFKHDQLAAVIRDFVMSRYLYEQGALQNNAQLLTYAKSLEDDAVRRVSGVAGQVPLSQFDYGKFARRFEAFYHKLR